MSFLIWLLGVAMVAASVGIVYKLCQNVIWPYNRFVFEHTNEHGVLVFEKYEDKIAHDKYKAKKSGNRVFCGHSGIKLVSIWKYILYAWSP